MFTYVDVCTPTFWPNPLKKKMQIAQAYKVFFISDSMKTILIAKLETYQDFIWKKIFEATK